MSYILKALRKSEKERQQSLEPNLASQLRVQNTGTYKNTGRLTFWLILLLFLNAGVLSYFIVNSLNSAPTDAPKSMATHALRPAGKTSVEPQQTAVSAPEDESISPHSPPDPTDQPLSIADLSQRLKKAARPAAGPSKPKDEAWIPPQEEPQSDAPVLEVEKLPEPVAIVETMPETRQESDQDAIPWLEDLPVQFRRSVPSLKINMHVYSKFPENRFVLVSMQKYFIDQEISADMVLKDIHSDGIVVSYHGRTFKIRR